MKRRMILAVLIITGFLAFNAVNIHASDVRVYLNGVQVDYSTVRDESGIVVLPQIIRDRLMVPIRQTAEIFGIELVWDPNTSTMTMKKDGVVSTHTIHTNIVNINGVAKQYDTPSMVIDGRTLMPNIMIADIINCDTRWDNSTRSVIMTSRPKAAPKPEVISAAANKSEVMIGEELIITVLTNSQTTSVNLVDSSGRVLGTSAQYTQSGENRSFTLRYTPTNQTLIPIQYKIQAGDASGYNKDATKSVMISVKQGMSVTSAYANVTSPYLNDTVNFVVTASEGVSRVRLTDTGTNQTYEQTSYTTVSLTGERKFSFDIKMTEKGDKTFSIEIGTNSFYIMDDKTIKLTVQNERASDPISIKDITVDNRTYYVGDTAYVRIRTSMSAEEVEIYDSYNRTTQKFTSYTTSSDYKTFEVSVRVNQNGTNNYTATAYDANRKSYDKSFTISTYGTNYGNIIQNYTVSRSGYNYYITLYTNTDVTNVYIEDGYGYYDNFNSYSSYSGNQLRWDISYYNSYSSYSDYIYVRVETYSYGSDYLTIRLSDY